jgi:MFS family permease
MFSQEVEQSPKSEPGFFRGYIVVVAALFIMVAIWGTYYAFGVFFKSVIVEFGWTRATTSGAFSLSMVLHGLLGVVMGGFTDRFGPRKVMTLCGFLLGLGYLLMSQISSVWQLYLFYGVIIGIGMGGGFVPLMSTVARWFLKRRSMMTGIVLAGMGTGSLIAPPLATRLISAYNWRVSYLILGSIILLVIVLAAQFLRRDPAQVRLAPYGGDKRRELGSTLETRSFSLKEAACTKQFWSVLGMFFCFGFCLFTVTVHIVLHVTELGISIIRAANILATIGGMSIIGNFVLGSAADRIGNRQVFIIGFVLMAATLFGFVLTTKAWVIYLFAVVFGFAHGGMGTSESPLVAGLFGLSSHGLIFGVVGVGFTMGAAIGPFLAGHIFDVMGSYQVAFLVCTAMGVVGLILTTFLVPIKCYQTSGQDGD